MGMIGTNVLMWIVDLKVLLTNSTVNYYFILQKKKTINWWEMTYSSVDALSGSIASLANQTSSYLSSYSNSTDKLQTDELQRSLKSSHPFYGVLLSVVSAVLVGGSFILQKKGIIYSTKNAPRKYGWVLVFIHAY